MMKYKSYERLMEEHKGTQIQTCLHRFYFQRTNGQIVNIAS